MCKHKVVPNKVSKKNKPIQLNTTMKETKMQIEDNNTLNCTVVVFDEPRCYSWDTCCCRRSA